MAVVFDCVHVTRNARRPAVNNWSSSAHCNRTRTGVDPAQRAELDQHRHRTVAPGFTDSLMTQQLVPLPSQVLRHARRTSEYQNLRNDFHKECSENICKNYWELGLSNGNKFIWIISNETPLVQRLATYVFQNVFNIDGNSHIWQAIHCNIQ
jgi:hypothetical protein